MISIIRTTSENEHFRRLVKQLDHDLAIKNGIANSFFAQFNKIDFINHVVLVFKNEFPVACGAMKPFDDYSMEVKRMFVPVEHRGNAYSKRVLTELQIWTKELNRKRLVLETGDKMTAAIALYKQSGFTIIPNYPPYENIATSICFEKQI